VCTAVADSALVTYDAALNRPAFQSSDSSTSYVPSYGNDNNYNTQVYTSKETHPWWAVDLGQPTNIYRVDIRHHDTSSCTKIAFVAISH